MRRHFGGFVKDIARGIAVRHDHGSQHVSHDFQREIAFLGVGSSPAFVRAPRATAAPSASSAPSKGTFLWARGFDTVEELRAALIEFRDNYNATWLIERHGFRPPSTVRQDRLSTAALAA